MQPTSEQAAILDLARGTSDNLMLNALAGCGKTTTLEMIERAVPTKPILYLAFNKRIADEAKDRMLSTTTVQTFNGCGHRIWSKFIPKKILLNPRKTQDLLRAIIDETPKAARGPIWDSFWEITHGVGMAKALGYVPAGSPSPATGLIPQGAFHAALEEAPDDLTADLIDAVLCRSISAAYQGQIDYNDQLYMPALFGGTFPRFPLVKVDEYQDLNPINHALLDKLVKHRLIGVGDPWQNIYAFRGAKQGGMDSAREKFKMTPCDLSISFRCPQAIVEAAHWHVPHFKWIKPGGHVEQLRELAAASIVDNSAIICRNNAPLFKLALRLLSSGRSVSVAGSDIGPKVIGLMRKLGDESMSREDLLHAITDWLAEKEGRGSKVAHDLADCMRVFAGFGATLSQAIQYAEHLFAQKGTIRLLTGHKAKGLEWETVYHLDPWLLRNEEQDLNLRYVIQTRSLDCYYEIDSKAIQW